MTQNFVRNPSVERLPNLLEELRNGTLRIPPIQRDFVWLGDQRLALCHSIWQGLPTGSLLVWRTKKALAPEKEIGPFAIDFRPVEPGAVVQYLIDGSQRMTTLLAALGLGLWSREDKQPVSASRTAPDETPWTIAFDLDTQAFFYDECDDPNELRSLPTLFADPANANRLPLSLLLDDLAFDEWRSARHRPREHVNRARALRSAFIDYLIPVVPLATDDLRVVALTFKRINSAGTPMSDVHMVRALTWNETFDLGEQLDSLKERLAPLGWSSIDNDTVLKVLSSVCGLDPTDGDIEALAEKIDKNPEAIAQAGNLLALAVELLLDLGIAGPGTLPYAQALVFSARAMGAVQSQGGLSQAKRRALCAWIAEACISERFGGAPDHMVRAAWRELLQRLGLAEKPKMQAKSPKPAKECLKFSMAWARSRVTAIVLATHGPQDAKGSAIANPARTLATQGTDAIGMFIHETANDLPLPIRMNLRQDQRLQDALQTPANRLVCPAEMLPQLRSQLWQADCPTAVRESHLIDKVAHDLLLAGSLSEFFNRRRAAILEAENRWLMSFGSSQQVQRSK